ncbi:hypothetical protein CmeUKMEL1_12525 [Cryptosporidium meleagridis]|uniref:Uncharacterized protein n=1 Tax=Cryptosporidium meleagridis TaxID=93969 RepID=A0A2P4Z309_9CRYT|nr:hypothetical protein CmeUKMEL1_12525 [Cryptosporidium meleagridis]
MDDNVMGLNAGVSGRKRRLSSDDEETPIKQLEDNVRENADVSSRESTPQIMVNKSTRSKRVLSSDSSDGCKSSGDESEESASNIQSQPSNYTTSEDESDSKSSDNESDDESDSSLSTRGRRKLVKTESGTPVISKQIKSENKQKKGASTSKKASTKSKSNAGSKTKSKAKVNAGNKTKSVVKKKRVSVEKDSNSQDCSSDEEENTAYVPRRDRDHKQILVAAILCRWWHALPDWPPPDTDYQALLKERNLRLVSIDDWEEAPDVDEDGFSKVYQLSEYVGVFRDSKGNAHDLRPKENKPCYSNLIKMEESKLYELLVTALESQIKTLEANSPGDSKLIDELKVELIEAQALLSRRASNKKK